MLDYNDKIYCQVKQTEDSCDFNLRGRASQDRISHLWRPLLKLLRILHSLIDEWQGLCPYSTYSVCPHCDLQNETPRQLWPLNFTPQYIAQSMFNCPRELRAIPKELIVPPVGIILEVIGGIDNCRPFQNLQERLSSEDCDFIATHIGQRHADLSRCLGLSNGEFESICLDYPKQHREQVYQILRRWKAASMDSKRSRFIEIISRLVPYPNDIIEAILYE